MVSTGIFLDKRRPLNDGTFPLKLRVTFNRKSRFYSLEVKNKKLALNTEDYDKIISIKPKREFNSLKKDINKALEDINVIIETIDNFTFERFEQIYKKKTAPTIDSYFDRKINSLIKEKSIRTAHFYKYTLRSLKEYDANLFEFKQITPDFLKKYEEWFLSKNGSSTTVGMYMRHLKAIMNMANEDGIITKQEYPFGKNKYIIPKGSCKREILTTSQIKKIYNCKDITPYQEKARDFWVFTYLANGMNMIDILLLKYENINGDKFTFVRHKTKKTAKANPVMVKVFLTEPLIRIIEKWGNKDKSKDNYIFPILNKEPETEKDIIILENFIRFVNQHMLSLTKKLGIPPVTTYCARHSYSHAMVNKNNANIVEIADNLGQTTITETRKYLKSLDEKAKKRYANKLVKLL